MDTIKFKDKIVCLPEIACTSEQEWPKNLHPKIMQILVNRGITENIEEFINCPIELLEKHDLKGLKEAVQIIKRAKEKNIKITVYGDYDADGVTGTAVALNVLKAIGCKVDYYINNRFEEGFGLNIDAVEKIASTGTKLIITVDNGVTAVAAVSRAQELGMAVIVTDHHEPGQELPPCLIVNPKQAECKYKFKHLAGVGVIFKVMHQLCLELGNPKLALKQLDLVAMGTVTDVVKLLGENRVMVKNGLKLINWGENTRVGFKALKEVTGVEQVKSYHLGFVLGPIINAEGRINGVPDYAVKLLTTSNLEEAKECAIFLQKLNKDRQNMVENQLEKAKSLIEIEKNIGIIKDESFNEGIVGLIAGKLKEEYQRPIIILTEDKDGNLKGSGRSIPEYSLIDAIDRVKLFLLNCGGHNQAIGLSLKMENFIIVKNILETHAKQNLNLEELEHKIVVDLVLDQKDITFDLLEALDALEPFGEGFPKPNFLIQNIEAKNIVILGGHKHLKFGHNNISFIMFNNTDLEEGCFDFLGYPKLNEWNGSKGLQFVISDFQKVI
jgi:single-stranded-DNA-specific exonuclease